MKYLWFSGELSEFCIVMLFTGKTTDMPQVTQTYIFNIFSDSKILMID